VEFGVVVPAPATPSGDEQAIDPAAVQDIADLATEFLEE
jgi:hypothetical protein